MRLKIKAGSITNLTDARFFASYAVDYIGFCFDPQSPNYISPQQALAIKGWIHGSKIVAEFANQDEDNVKNIIQFLEPDVVQFHASGFEVQGSGLPVILTSSVDEIKNVYAKNYLFVFIDNYNDEDISVINFPIMVDITNKQIDLSNPKIMAVQITGTPESEVGIKNYETFDALLKKIELL